jgi:hypothetical protein
MTGILNLANPVMGVLDLAIPVIGVLKDLVVR